MTVEITAKKVDDAIKEGLEKLGATLDQVTVEVLESGGLFRKAKVRLTLDEKESPEPVVSKNAERKEVNAPSEKSDKKPTEKAESKPTDTPDKAERKPASAPNVTEKKASTVPDSAEKPAGAAKKAEPKHDKHANAKAKNAESKNERAPRTSAQSPTENGQRAEKSRADESTQNDAPKSAPNGTVKETSSDAKERRDAKKPSPKKQVADGQKPAQSNRKKSAEELKALEGALEFVKATVEKMGFDVTVKPAENDPEHIEIEAAEGDDSLIIGRHGETLSALSYLAETCARAEKTRINVTVDCNGYRSRRAASLTAMARRRADECAAKRRKIKLEPMERIDRRTVHTALGDDDRVTTASEGKEPYRYVVIYPSRADRRAAAPEETND